MSEFSVSDCLRQVLETTSLSDPRAIAAEMLDRIPRAARGAVLAQVLPLWVQGQVSRRRLLSPVAAAPVPSPKVAAVRDDWAVRLNTPLCVDGLWKRLADCTANDLRTVAASLRALAAKTAAKADYYVELADLVPAGGTVGMLTADPWGAAA